MKQQMNSISSEIDHVYEFFFTAFFCVVVVVAQHPFFYSFLF